MDTWTVEYTKLVGKNNGYVGGLSEGCHFQDFIFIATNIRLSCSKFWPGYSEEVIP